MIIEQATYTYQKSGKYRVGHTRSSSGTVGKVWPEKLIAT